jgi:hypothetical protein
MPARDRNRLSLKPRRRYTELLQVLRRQPRQDRVVDLILAECRLILFEAKPPQPICQLPGDPLQTKVVARYKSKEQSDE